VFWAIPHVFLTSLCIYSEIAGFLLGLLEKSWVSVLVEIPHRRKLGCPGVLNPSLQSLYPFSVFPFRLEAGGG